MLGLLALMIPRVRDYDGLEQGADGFGVVLLGSLKKRGKIYE
jgi:ribosomal protein L5